MKCRVCSTKAKYKCNETDKCQILYCSQKCGDQNIASHICSQFIGATWGDLSNDAIQSILFEVPFDQIWRLSATEKRIRDLIRNNKGFRKRYLRRRSSTEIQDVLMDALEPDEEDPANSKNSNIFLNIWLEDAINTGQFDIKYKGYMPIVLAIVFGYTNIVKLLLDKGTPVNFDDDVLIIAASRLGRTDIVQLLINYGANVSARKSQPIIEAAKNGHADIVQLLINNGVRPIACFGDALIQASAKGYTDVVKILVDSIPSFRGFFSEMVDDALKRAHTAASEAGHDEIAEMLDDALPRYL